MNLTILETSSIQPFIFGSNDLRENIGASELAYLATSEWAFDALEENRLRHNIDRDTGKIKPDARIESGQLDAEVIFFGGGGMAVLFTAKEAKAAERMSKDFVYSLNLRLLRESPGLMLAAAHTEVDFYKDCLRQKKDEAGRRLQRALEGGSAPLLGLGVTVADASTGWPTVGFTDVDDDTIDINEELPPRSEVGSAQRQAKLKIVNRANGRLRSYFQQVRDAGYEFNNELDKLGGKPGEENYLAVIHIDGNGMGKRRYEIEVRHTASGVNANRAYIEEIRGFSEGLKDAAERALNKAVDELLELLPTYFESREQNKDVFPLRPIVYGGDDITLVCDGPLGAGFAVNYLKAFQDQKLTDGEPGYATAGVAIVKKHYPFSRACDLADDLRRKARKRVEEVAGQKKPWKGTAVDWHITAGGLLGDLDAIRAREYQAPDGNLTMKPLLVHQSDPGHRDWETFVEMWSEFNKPEWLDSRNKRAALREVLRQGTDAVQEFCAVYRRDGLPTVGSPPQGRYGWITSSDGEAKLCLHFDALEALDFVQLEVQR